MTIDLVQAAIENGVLVLKLNRPAKLNALTMDMYRALNEGFDQASLSDEIGALLIVGNGDHFSAGNDMKDFLTMATGAEALDPETLPVVGLIRRLVSFEKPLVVAVQGQAVGIGLTLTLHADFVYLADTAVISAPFVELGLVPEAGSSMLLPQKVGSLRASEILLAAKALDAATALTWGLANEVLPAADLHEAAFGTAQMLAKKPREAMTLSKKLMCYDREALSNRVDAEIEIFFTRLRSPEAQAAFSSFLSR